MSSRFEARRRRRHGRPDRNRCLHLEPLEDRRMLSVFTVNSAGDEVDAKVGDGKAETAKGTTTLRAAIMEANFKSDKDSIEFNIPGSGPHVIQPQLPLPVVVYPIGIDGYTQPGAVQNFAPLQQQDAVIKIELDGSKLPLGSNGLVLWGGNSGVFGLAIHSFFNASTTPVESLDAILDSRNGSAITLWGNGGNQIAGNFLGTKADGSPMGMATGITVGSHHNEIWNNVASWATHSGIAIGGIFDFGSTWFSFRGLDNTVAGNILGTGRDGTSVSTVTRHGHTWSGNAYGITISFGSQENTIGGNSATQGNLISANRVFGIGIVGTSPDGTQVGENVIQGNLIGTDKTGQLIDPDGQSNSGDELGNRKSGIQIFKSPQNIIGGTLTGEGNVISGNLTGILIADSTSKTNILRGNKIGTDTDGDSPLGNRGNGIELQDANGTLIDANLISANGSAGIRVSGDDAQDNHIRGNKIGTKLNGQQALANAYHGVYLDNVSENLLENNTISGNRGSGIAIEGLSSSQNTLLSNRIGIDAVGDKALPNKHDGIEILQSHDNHVVSNIISGNGQSGVLISGSAAKNNVLAGNLIGTDANGSAIRANGQHGVYILQAPDNHVGSTDIQRRNVISGNHDEGIFIQGEKASGNQVFGNYIGLDAPGTDFLPNRNGIVIVNAPGNTIGGVTPTVRNVISGNVLDGVVIQGEKSTGNLVQGNYIGTDHSGTLAVANAVTGVLIDNAPGNTVGGSASPSAGKPPGNVISGNATGVHIRGAKAQGNRVQGNVVGRSALDAPLGNLADGIVVQGASGTIVGYESSSQVGTLTCSGDCNAIASNRRDAVRVEDLPNANATDNLVRRNQIFDNGGLGINLVGGEQRRTLSDGVTPNDVAEKDQDIGPNQLLNFPVGITSWYDEDSDKTIVSGVLVTKNPEQTDVDLYMNQSRDTTGFGEGRFFLTSAQPDKSGAVSFTLPGKLKYPYLSATAVVRNGGSTSEFSPVCDTDTDEDGLPDDWEIHGIDFDGDGNVDLDLPKLGASKHQKDIFLEIDYMAMPNVVANLDAAISEIQTAFYFAPVPRGIALHVDDVKQSGLVPTPAVNDLGSQLKEVLYWKQNPKPMNDFAEYKDKYFGSDADRKEPAKAPLILGAKGLIYHYGIVALKNEYLDAGGLSELQGNDFLVEGRGLGWRELAEAMMHEFGHNLGLLHGGPMSSESEANDQSRINKNPIQFSIMNYAYLNWRVTADDKNVRPLDYSRFSPADFRELDEAQLVETDGIYVNGPPSQTGPLFWKQWPKIAWSSPAGGIATAPNNDSAKDWDQDGVPETQAYQRLISSHGFDPTPQILQSLNEWSHLRYNFRVSEGFDIPFATSGVSRADSEAEKTASAEEIHSWNEALDGDEDGINNAIDNVPFVYNPDQLDSDGNGIGDAGELLGLTLSDTSAPGNTDLTGTVTLQRPAPQNGAQVELFSGEPWLLDLPRHVVIPAGSRTAAFSFKTTSLASDVTPVHVYAAYGADLHAAALSVGPGMASTDLVVTKTTSDDSVSVGQTLSYQITVTNQGPQPVIGVQMVDALPENVALVSAEGTSGREPIQGPGLSIRFDYTYDAANFFDTQEKRELLELAGRTMTEVLGDDLAAIDPEGLDTWTALFENPSTGDTQSIVNLVVPENELVIFVGARDLGTQGQAVNEGALAGPGGYLVSGSDSFMRLVAARGEAGAELPEPTDFGTWGGAISFNTNPAVKFHFKASLDELDSDELDFLTIAMHEVGHVLGFGSSESWYSSVDDTNVVFRGLASIDAYDGQGNVPLDAQLMHWQQDITDSGEQPLLTPGLPLGSRIHRPTELDWAGLADVGWNTNGILTTARSVPLRIGQDTITADIGSLAAGQSATLSVDVVPLAPGNITNRATISSPYLSDPNVNNNAAEMATNVLPKQALVVNTTDDFDDGVADEIHTSLREAINWANQLGGPDTILFDIPGPGPHSIQPQTALPEITDTVTIDGRSQPDFAGVPVIELNGSSAGTGTNGLVIRAGDSVVRGLVINQFEAEVGDLQSGNGIALHGTGNAIVGCRIGTDHSGTLSRGNANAGILVAAGHNIIGGDTPEMRNVVSGNSGPGISIVPTANENQLLGNFIGTNASGDAALGNLGNGIEILSASGNIIGGSSAGAGNVISGNRTGVALLRGGTSLSTFNHVIGNYIGTDATGSAALGNQTGILLVQATRNTIGGTEAGAGNVISGNQVGIHVTGYEGLAPTVADANRIQANLIGTAADGIAPLGNLSHGVFVEQTGLTWIGGENAAEANKIAHNTGDGVYVATYAPNIIRRNAIFDNGELGIDLYGDGVSVNYPATASAFYYLPNYPELTRVFTGNGSTTVEGAITGPILPAQGLIQEVALDFYATATADASGHGEGEIYLGSTSAWPRGTETFRAVFPVEVPAGFSVAATATREEKTSEFSRAILARADTDGDSVLDEVEDGGPNGGDANLDGIPDRLQNETASLPNAVNGNYVVLEASSGFQFRDIKAVDNPSPHDGPPGVVYPVGFFELMLDGAVGTVSLHSPAGSSFDTVYNYGATPDRTYKHWYQLPAVDVLSDRVVLHLTDGSGWGDHDLERNDRVVTLTGPALIPVDAGTTIVVNSADDVDDGEANENHTSLREAINLSNFLPGKDRIVFGIPGDGPHTIQPTSSPNPLNPNYVRVSLPWLTDPVIVDGYTQPGAIPATEDDPATLMIEIDGGLAPGSNGLWLLGGDSVIRGLAINRFGLGTTGRGGTHIAIHPASYGTIPGQNRIEGNYIGTDISGTYSYLGPTSVGAPVGGIVVSSPDNTIGGTSPASRNVISGFTGVGVEIYGRYDEPMSAANNRVQGNYIGTDATGTVALGSGTGIRIVYASATIVGGTAPGAGNTIAGNPYSGIQMQHSRDDEPGSIVQGNLIGTDASGTLPLGNGDAGIGLFGWNHTIGGTEPGAGNVISANGASGIWILGAGDFSGPQPAGNNSIRGNYIGTDRTGTVDLGNGSHGIEIASSQGNLIGGLDAQARNVITHNNGNGIVITGGMDGNTSLAQGNAILSNHIHSNAMLAIDLGGDGVTENDRADGYFRPAPLLLELTVEELVDGADYYGVVSGPPNAMLGYTLAFDRWPTILQGGILTDDGGIGTFQTGYRGVIDTPVLLEASVTDWERIAWVNNEQNYPLLQSATVAGATTITGMLDATPDREFHLEFFVSEDPDASGFGEGQSFLGTTSVTTDTNGLVDFSSTFPIVVKPGRYVTATATDLFADNTSEFSAAILVAPPANQLDFADAPDPRYATMLADDGARHVIVPGLHMGATIDAELDGQPNGPATGDDTDGNDDEDGVQLPTSLTAGQTVPALVTATGEGFLSAWVDFNADGDWLDEGEQVLDDIRLQAGETPCFWMSLTTLSRPTRRSPASASARRAVCPHMAWRSTEK